VDDIVAPVGAEGVHLQRDPDLLQKLLLKLEKYPSKQGDMFVFSGEEPELAVEGYTSEQITYHLEQLKKMGLIDSPGSQPMLGVTSPHDAYGDLIPLGPPRAVAGISHHLVGHRVAVIV
jgi:hypothetical protein